MTAHAQQLLVIEHLTSMANFIQNDIKKILRSKSRIKRILLRPGLEYLARQLRAEAVAMGDGLIEIPEYDGYIKFNSYDLAGTGDSINKMAKLCESRINAPPQDIDITKPLWNVLLSEDLLQHKYILDIALHDEILAAAARYLGQVPRLYNLRFWWSPPNKTASGSQLYHYDHRDSRQVKLFINLNDIYENSGPLHFLSASNSERVNARIGYSQKRYNDEKVYSACPESEVVTNSGARGAAAIIDTARCLHYGSRGNERDRLIFMAIFARANSISPGPGCAVLDPVRHRLVAEFYDTDPVRTFALTAPK